MSVLLICKQHLKVIIITAASQQQQQHHNKSSTATTTAISQQQLHHNKNYVTPTATSQECIFQHNFFLSLIGEQLTTFYLFLSIHRTRKKDISGWSDKLMNQMQQRIFNSITKPKVF